MAERDNDFAGALPSFAGRAAPADGQAEGHVSGGQLPRAPLHFQNAQESSHRMVHSPAALRRRGSHT